jgi:uncharacterized protein (DUF2252 family)
MSDSAGRDTRGSPRSPAATGRLDLAATRAERRAAGKEGRARAPRGDLGSWSETERGHDPLETVLAQNGIRDPGLVPLRHERMAASPWSFYRGAAAVMAEDLASRPDSGLTVQLCGDAHVLNFGLWATPERNLFFDLRDFDETLAGPFEWDLKRLVTSLVVAARESGVRQGRGEDAAAAAAEAYRGRMRRHARSGELEIWYDGTHADSLLSYFEPADRGRVSVHIEKQAKHRTHRGAYAKLVTMAHGRPRITEEPPIRVTVGDEEQSELVETLIAEYRVTLQEDRRHLFDRYTEADMVRQVVGVGSVGMRVYLVLLEGRSGADPLFLQFKQAGRSVYESAERSSAHVNQGERVINGKRLVQSATDIFVGWGSFQGNDYYARQFRDMKIIPKIQLISPVLTEFATACGESLARAHARSGDPVAIDAYLGKGAAFDRSMVQFARLYADQNERDHARLVDAIASGTIERGPGEPSGAPG